MWLDARAGPASNSDVPASRLAASRFLDFSIVLSMTMPSLRPLPANKRSYGVRIGAEVGCATIDFLFLAAGLIQTLPSLRMHGLGREVRSPDASDAPGDRSQSAAKQ
jgi:hypothetical protein